MTTNQNFRKAITQTAAAKCWSGSHILS